jgi:hypothetical protein
MRRLSLFSGLVALTALGCSDPGSLLPTSPSPPNVVSLEIAGPASIAPGQSVQLLANLRLADGTIKQPSPGTPVQWFSTNNNVLRVTGGGFVSGGNPGDARITVIHGTGATSRSANREFVVTPDGTFRLVGTVYEADFPSVPILNARVTVNGSLTYITAPDGGYRLYGVPADAVVTVSKAGYTPITQSLRLTQHTTQNFNLPLSGSRLTISGLYTMTLDATTPCSSGTPLNSSLRRRTYDATVTQNGPDVTVLLTEARFRLNSLGRGNRFSGRASSDAVAFALDPYDAYYYPYYGPAYYPNVAERLADNTILVPQGNVVATASGAGLSGTMDGSIFQWNDRFPNSNLFLVGYCYSTSIQFALTPR